LGEIEHLEAEQESCVNGRFLPQGIAGLGEDVISVPESGSDAIAAF
jgi:hypothetical protein